LQKGEVGLKLRDARGLPQVTHIPPPLALAIIKALRRRAMVISKILTKL
jgi:hypothetical protein